MIEQSPASSGLVHFARRVLAAHREQSVRIEATEKRRPHSQQWSAQPRRLRHDPLKIGLQKRLANDRE